jgi:hypothetical protein
VGFCPLQLSLHNLVVQEAFWRGGVVFACFSRENDKEATCGYEAVVWGTTRGDFVTHCNLRRRLSDDKS